MDTNDVVVGGLPCDRDKGISGLCQLEGELFGRHGASLPAAAAWVALATFDALAKNGGVSGVRNIGGVRKNYGGGGGMCRR